MVQTRLAMGPILKDADLELLTRVQTHFSWRPRLCLHGVDLDV